MIDRDRGRREFIRDAARLLGGTVIGGGLLAQASCRRAGADRGWLEPDDARGLRRVDQRVAAAVGRTDDTPRIAAAIERAVRSWRGDGGEPGRSEPAIVELSGEFRLGSTLQVPSGVMLKGGTLRRTARPGYVGLGSFASLLGVHLIGEGEWDPSVDAHHRRQPAISTGSSAGRPPNENWAVIDCVIEGFWGYGFNTGEYGGRGLLEGNVIQDNASAGIQLIWSSPGCVVRNNVIRRNGYNGIDCNASGSVIEGNRCSGNGRTRVDTSDKSGILVTAFVDGMDLADISVAGNFCHSNARHGIYIAGTAAECYRVTALRNECDRNGIAGISLEGSRVRRPAGWKYYLSDVELGYNGCHDNRSSGILRGANQFTFVQNCRLHHNEAFDNRVRDISVCPGVDPAAEPFDVRLVDGTNRYGSGPC